MQSNNNNYPIANNLKINPKLKPTTKLTGENGNIFNLVAICRKSLHNMPNAFNEMWERIQQAKSYDMALQIIMEYVNVK